MSTTFVANAIIGSRVLKSANVVTTQDRGCSHAQLLGARFCPECGKATVVKRTRKLINEDDLPEGFTLVSAFDDGTVFVGVIVAKNSLDDCIDLGELDGATRLDSAELVKAKQRVREFLEPLGVWNEKEYGLWAVQTVF